jgi:hypothetical protein
MAGDPLRGEEGRLCRIRFTLDRIKASPEATGRALQEAMRWRSHARDFSAREGVRPLGCCGVSPQRSAQADGAQAPGVRRKLGFRPGGKHPPYMMSKPSERVRLNTIKSGVVRRKGKQVRQRKPGLIELKKRELTICDLRAAMA